MWTPRPSWARYVVGFTPILVDKKACNAIEHYLSGDGHDQTTYQYRNGSFDQSLKTFVNSTGFIHNLESNAEWRMQFIWPFVPRIWSHYNKEKGETVVAHPNRKYAWIMLRQPDYKKRTTYNWPTC